MNSTIYLDNSATTRVRDEVVEAMLPCLKEDFGNPSSIHRLGHRAQSVLNESRQQIAGLLNCQASEIYFTPCGTYANNVAILGRARFIEANGLGRHLITSQIEHPSLMGPAQHLESLGWKVTYLPVDKQGAVKPEDLQKAISSQTSIISIMWANNEIGTVQPAPELAEIAAQRQIYFHTDAIQVAGRLPIDLSTTNISALSLSGHKFYAPKGIGALFLRKGVNLMPIVFGGGQEQGLFPGTEGLANIAALGKAAELSRAELDTLPEFLQSMQKVIIDRLSAVDGLKFTGASKLEHRLPGHVSIVLPGVEGEALVNRANLKGICISSGSACHKGIMEPSHVLKALHLSAREAMGSARITVGRFNSEEECLQAADALVEIFKSCRDSASKSCSV